MGKIRWLKRTVLAALAFFISLYPAAHPCAQAITSDQNTLSFLLAIGAQIARNGHPTAVPVEDGLILTSGDRIKFFLKTASAGYFFLIYLGPSRNLSLLFPHGLKNAHIPSGQQFYIPQESLWFKLSATPGVENFFFLAPKSRLNKLEDLSARHANFRNRSELLSSTQAIR